MFHVKLGQFRQPRKTQIERLSNQRGFIEGFIEMNKMPLVIAFSVFVVGCNNNWKPDYIAYANVKQIKLSGLTGKPGIEFNIGYWETDNYSTRQMFKKYTADTIDFFSPGIDITYIAFERYYNPPKYKYESTFLNNTLTVIISYFDEENI